MATKLKVTYTDGKAVEVLAGPRAQVAAERHFKKALPKIAQENGVEGFYFLAWAALHFAGLEPKDFDQFLDVLDDVDDAEQAEDPTAAGQ